uniref:NTP_transf_2 domain-containing protein n=1 Tax=Strongyloides papillosus TaxID=174720 RepID=A0A0N5CB40_STREA
MSFLSNKRYLIFTVKNVRLISLQRICKYFIKSIDNPYDYDKSEFKEKFQILEDKLELMDKRRAKYHDILVQKTKSKLTCLKNCICNEKSDLIEAGSLVTGLTTTTNSDVDLVFIVFDDESNIFQEDFINNISFRSKFMKTVSKLITNDQKLWNTKVDKMFIILHAKVPIIKLEFKDGTKFDIQFCNYQTLKNTNLMRYYAASDPRYRKVYIYAKVLASNLNIIGGEKGLLTSYQISILVAHFFQMSLKNQQAVLPVIPQFYSSFVSPHHSLKEVVRNLSRPIDVSKLQLHINQKPLASHLAMQFIDYFANFDFISYAIFINKRYPVHMFQVDPSPKLQIFDSYSNESISNSHRALEAFSTNMKYLQGLMKRGYFIDPFPNLNKEKYKSGIK